MSSKNSESRPLRNSAIKVALASGLAAAKQLLMRSRAAMWSLLLPPLAPLVKIMADTGYGTDRCLTKGCLPLPIHFYSPVPDLQDLRARGIWSRRSELPGLDFRGAEQLELLAELGREFGVECKWPQNSIDDPQAFFTNNSGFSYGCAASTHCVIRKFQPRRFVEIGSGMSTRVIAEALRLNRVSSHESHYTIIDPFPSDQVKRLSAVNVILAQRVETADVSIFESLRAGDILFIDSGHTVRIGGDVNFLILEVLPRLAPGVIVHFHDIPMPYEYSELYYTNEKFRMLWTESYLLQAFLSCNSHFRILLAMNYLILENMNAVRDAWPHYDPTAHVQHSHSFWIMRQS